MNDRSLELMHKRSQAWVMIRNMEADIERIAKEGPTRPEDVPVMRMAMYIVSGEIKARRTGDAPL